MAGSPLRRWSGVVGAGALGVLVGAGLVLAVLFRFGGTGGRLEPAPAGPSPAASVYRRVAPSVVLVANQGAVPTLLGPQQRLGWGSGVIFDPRGYIVTNDHVVAGARRLAVTLANGRTLPAQVVGGDPATDLAVVRVEAGGPLPAAAFADTDTVDPGEVAVAIGNPLGPQFAQSVTQGVVSAVRPMLYGLDPQDRRVTEMIQTDAAINPGNSGGPLCDAAGEVIGINSIQVPLISPGIAASGLGFAIPSGTVEHVAGDLVRYGYVKRAWLGAFLQVTPPDALPSEPQSVEVGGLAPGGPAEAAGLRVGERIVAWNASTIKNYYDLVLRVNAAAPGERVRLTVGAGGGTHVVSVVLGTAPAASGQGA